MAIFYVRNEIGGKNGLAWGVSQRADCRYAVTAVDLKMLES